MIDISVLREYLSTNHDALAKWGDFIAQQIRKALDSDTNGGNLSHFIKIPVEPRVKDVDSAIGKVGRKGYTEFNQLTDLVGVRFVVLLSDHIHTICEIIENEPVWDCEVSKDFQVEIENNPKIFDYQSKHYEIRPKDDFEVDGILITKCMCCEVQVRSLLQHAYAEIVHDNLYKPVGPVPTKAERQVAKSMALMETTDDLFCNMMKLLTDTNLLRNNLLNDLTQLYREKIGGHLIHTDAKTCYAVLDEYRELLKESVVAETGQLLSSKKFISTQIHNRAPSNPFFAQPVVLLIYWLVINVDIKDLIRRWPLPGYQRELDVVLSDLDAGQFR